MLLDHTAPMKLIGILSLILLAQIVVARAATSVYDVPLKDINGKPASLKDYQGKVLLVVNVASKCGLTPQYKELEALQKKYHGKGFTIVAFPCNDFGSQEPGTAAEIQEFCSKNYAVTFPLFEKLHVKGAEQHPLYVVLTGKDSPFPGDIKWNFGKFLIGKDGKILKRFEPQTKPESPEVIEAIEVAVAAR